MVQTAYMEDLTGWHLQVWDANIIYENGIQKLLLSYTDPDGHNNFPGTVSAQVTYALLDNNALEITYRADTDKATPFNPTNHCYFNLSWRINWSQYITRSHCANRCDSNGKDL